MDELMNVARGRGARVLVGRSWEAGGAPAYWPWIQALRAYVRDTDPAVLREQLGSGAADLAQLLSEVRELFPDPPELPTLESEAARFRLFEAASSLLRRASESQPLLLALDDLHAADEASLLLLQFLARELAASRLLVIAAYRDVDPRPTDSLTRAVTELAREPVTRIIALAGLGERDVAGFIELTSGESPSDELVRAIHEETEGNPLFVGEIVRLLAAEGRLDARDASPLGIPRSVRDVIARRVRHLSEECNRLLVLASVLGREFALDVLARAGDVSEDDVLDALDEAMAARVVSDVPESAGRLRFAHVLIRDTLYEELTAARRMRLHRLALEALERVSGDEPGDRLSELVHHAVAGRDFAKALTYARRAGDRALALLAYEHAARLYQTALDALDAVRPSDDTMRCELLLSLGEAESAGDRRAAKKAFLAAAEIARRLGLARELARAAAGYGGRIAFARAGEDERLVPLLEEGLAVLRDDEVELRVRLLARLAGALRDEPSRERRDALSKEAVALARRTGNASGLGFALAGRVPAILAPDTVGECLALSSELLELAERTGDREQFVYAHMYGFGIRLVGGDIRAAERDLEAMSRVADELRQPAQLWFVLSGRAMLATLAGRLTDAEELVANAFALGERAQPEVAIPVYRLLRYTLSDLQGGLETIEPEVSDLVREYPARPVCRCALAHLHARLGQADRAGEELAQLAVDGFSRLPFDMEWLFGMSLLAETCSLLGDADSAAILYRLVLPYGGLAAADYPEGNRGSMFRYLGLLAATMQRWSEAERHFRDAVGMNGMMGALPWLARTQRDYAQMLVRRGAPGDDRRAQTLLGEALAAYRELGMATDGATGSASPQEIRTAP